MLSTNPLIPFDMGRNAYQRGLPSRCNPFTADRNARYEWYLGYYEARTQASAVHILARYGLSFP